MYHQPIIYARIRLKHFFSVCISMVIIIFKNSMLLWQRNNTRQTDNSHCLAAEAGSGPSSHSHLNQFACVSGLLAHYTDCKGIVSPRD